MTRKLPLLIAALVALLASCYRIDLIDQAHEAVTNSTFSGRIVVKADGTTDNGSVQHVRGLYGICLPEGWSVDGTIVMTQKVKPGTDLGDEAYSKDITRSLIPSEKYSDLLNTDYPRRGYRWHGFITDADFKSMFNNADPAKDVDCIYADFRVRTDSQTGVFLLDYTAGHISADHADEIGSYDRDWATRAATFRGFRINTVTHADTRVRVTDADGSCSDRDDSRFEAPTLNPDWNLELIPDGGGSRSVMAYRDLAYDGLFTRDLGWNGGDGGLTVALPDGNIFWTYNDSFWGKLDADRNRDGSRASFPRNTAAIQTVDAEGNPGLADDNLIWLNRLANKSNPRAKDYYCAYTFIEDPRAKDYNDRGIAQDRCYWSADGAIVDNQLQMLWVDVDAPNLVNHATALAIYSLDGTPGDGEYMREISVDHNFIEENPQGYGSTLWEDEDGHIYLYATYSVPGEMRCFPIVARTASRDLRSEWQYYVADSEGHFSWQSAYPTADQLKRSGISDVSLTVPWVWKEGDYYYMVGQQFVYSRTMYILRSKTPYGPFAETKILMEFPDHIYKLGNQHYKQIYLINMHQPLSREGEIVLSSNITSDWNDNFNAPGSADCYRPNFYRVYNWKSLFDQSGSDAIDFIVADSEQQRPDRRYFNLQGIEVKSPTPGLYIHNGQLEYVK